MEQLIAKRYVKALMASMRDKEIVKASRALATIAAAFEDKKFARIMASPEVRREQREELVVSLLGKKADKKVTNFLKVLGVHNRFALIPLIAKLLEKELQHRANRYEGVVESGVQIDKALIKELETSLSRYADATIVLKPVKSDRDGIRVTVEDLGLEASFSKERVASDMISHILKAL